jgi:Cu+-exporting ATPase
VTGVVVTGAEIDENGLLRLAASTESGSEHPLGEAIVEEALRRGLDLSPASEFEASPGLGVEAVVEGERVRIGSPRFLSASGIEAGEVSKKASESASRGETPVLVARGATILGIVSVADPVREGASDAIREMRALGLDVIMLTGDQQRTAEAVARQVGIEQVVAGVLPGRKAEEIERLRGAGRRVAMVGDGINDAPALAVADLGIAIGTGTDVAIAASDVTLVGADLHGVVASVRLARRTIRTIRQNLFWAFAYNTLGIPLAAGLLYPWTGWLLSPVFASAAMSFSSVSVVTNSLRLRRFGG